jgi:hypothetical protein
MKHFEIVVSGTGGSGDLYFDATLGGIKIGENEYLLRTEESVDAIQASARQTAEIDDVMIKPITEHDFKRIRYEKTGVTE